MEQVKNKKIKLLKVQVFPFSGIELPEQVLIVDHINLSGASLPDIGFVPLGDLYLNRADVIASKAKQSSIPDEEIIVVCLKDGVKPTLDEEAVLKRNGVKAYTYELLDETLRAASNGEKVLAIGLCHCEEP